MSLATIVNLDKTAVNDIFRKLTTEPKALLIYWLARNPGSHSIAEIREGISRDFGFEATSSHCFDNALIHGYFKQSLKEIIKTSSKTNPRPGPGIINGYSLDIEGKEGYDNIGEIAAHALYASSTISGHVGEIITLSRILYGAPSEEHSATGSPAHVALILAAINNFDFNTMISASDLSYLIDFDNGQTTLHLNHLDRMDCVRLWQSHQTAYRLNARDDLETILERNRAWLIGIPETMPDISLSVAQRVIDFLKTMRYHLVSLEEIQANVQNITIDGPNRPYNEVYLGRILARIHKLGIIEIVGHALVQKTYKGQEIANVFISPIISAINGDTTLLKQPTNEQVYNAINAYNSIKYAK